MRGITILFLFLGLLACRRSSDEAQPAAGSQAPPSSAGSGSGAGVARSRTDQVAPPFAIQTPPADATKTASGLVYKKLTTNDAGAQPKRNDTVLINYTGWRQSTGDTFFTNRGRGQPLPLNLSQAAPGFTEALQLLHKGEKAVMWVPPEIGYKTPPTQGKAETLVYEVEVVDIDPAPAVPDDVAKPPDKAESLPHGTRRVVVRPGTGTDKVRPFDTVTYHYTAWDGEGRMIDSSESRKHPATTQPYKESVGKAEMLTSMVQGERSRFWLDAEKLVLAGVKPLPVTKGPVCFEVEVQQLTKVAHEPPLPPPDVAKPPDGVKKTAKGVFYRLLKAGPGKDPRHPEAKDTVKVHYTGWTTDGRMFDSSLLRGEPATFSLGGVIAGWTDGIPVMTQGDHVRFWIPEPLAYKGQAGKPAGMLVFDVELLEIMPAVAH